MKSIPRMPVNRAAWDDAFRELCTRFGVDAAFYIPRVTPDGLLVTGSVTGGYLDSAEYLEALIQAGATVLAKRWKERS